MTLQWTRRKQGLRPAEAKSRIRQQQSLALTIHCGGGMQKAAQRRRHTGHQLSKNAPISTGQKRGRYIVIFVNWSNSVDDDASLELKTSARPRRVR